MKRKLSGREKTMIVLLAVAAVIGYRLMSGDGIGSGAGSRDDQETRDFGDPPVVRMDLLTANQDEFDPAGRNLFAYYVPPAPPPRPAPRPPRRPLPPPRAFTPPPAPSAPVRPVAPKPNFNYLGYLGPKDARIAVFDSKTEGVKLARVGDLVRNDFRLLEFKHEGVTLGYTDARWQGATAELLMAGAK